MKQGILFAQTSKLMYAEIAKNHLGFDVEQCPYCKTGKMMNIIETPLVLSVVEVIETKLAPECFCQHGLKSKLRCGTLFEGSLLLYNIRTKVEVAMRYTTV